jgi:hypothetical protein
MQLAFSAQKQKASTSVMRVVPSKMPNFSNMASSTVHTKDRLTEFVWHAFNWDIHREM